MNIAKFDIEQWMNDYEKKVDLESKIVNMIFRLVKEGEYGNAA